MVNSNYSRDKLSQCKIGGPSKPYVDKNLQLQHPEWDHDPSPNQSSHSPIYSHYIGSSPASHFPSPINEGELYHAMEQAEHSYEAWRQMQKKLDLAIKAHRE